MRQALGNLDRAAKKGVIHANAAARRKSRLVLKYNAAVAAQQVQPEQPKGKSRQKKASPGRKRKTEK